MARVYENVSGGAVVFELMTSDKDEISDHFKYSLIGTHSNQFTLKQVCLCTGLTYVYP